MCRQNNKQQQKNNDSTNKNELYLEAKAAGWPNNVMPFETTTDGSVRPKEILPG